MRDNRLLGDCAPDQFREAYYLLRTQVLQCFRKNNWQVLAVSSPGEGEGKSLTAINLAISISREIAHSVLLVDADLRRPRLLDHFGIPARRGLGDYLTADLSIEQLLVRPEHIEDLYILPGGRPLERSSEMLNSAKMNRLLCNMRACHDNLVIIFDLPPVMTSTDTLVFAGQADATLLVVEDGSTQRQDLAGAIERLGNTSIVGTVLNKGQV
ncbi:MAG: CpsD/CapB family tyrosine-protein kinase [Thiohalobacterales bacterium]|nr:CpsD/CapB family tyrosine-protein kinase [Thiohalobacterales bacterium]